MCGPKTLCYTTDNVCYLVQDVQEGMKIAKNSQKKPNFAKFLLLFCLFRWALAKLNICESSFLSPHANPQDRFFKLVNGFRHWETLSLEQIIRHSEPKSQKTIIFLISFNLKTPLCFTRLHGFQRLYLTLPTMDKSFTKHLPFSLLAKNLKKQSFEARSSNHSGIFKSENDP